MDEELDCGDNSCSFATKRGGQRTNGGCRCLKALDSFQERKVRRLILSLRARLAQLETDNAAMQAVCEAARKISVQSIFGGYSLDHGEAAKTREAIAVLDALRVGGAK